MDDLTERRVAIEAIATLARMKNVMVDRILKPAGVPQDLYVPLLRRRDDIMNRLLSKRQMAPLIVDALQDRPECGGVIRAIVSIAAAWDRFELADDEYTARATVEKARDVLRLAEHRDSRHAEVEERARREAAALREREESDRFRKESDLLLQQFDSMGADSVDAQRRGYLLEDLLDRLFRLHAIPVHGSFRRNEGSEQIDGAFQLGGWHYLVECRWRKAPADIGDLDGLRGKIGRSGKQTMGLFLSINGWSQRVPQLLKQNPDKSIILMEGYALRTTLCGQLGLREYLEALITNLNLRGEPALSAAEYLRQQTD